ncbi:hypothetical protein ACFL0P_00430 [Candidatus Omnitrophota bacterium]
MKKLIIVTTFFIFTVATQGFTELSEALAGDLGIEIGLETSHITYEEPGVMEEKGMMYGVNCSLTYRGWLPPSPAEVDKYMLRIEGRYSYGEVDYDGSLSDGTPYTIDNIDDYMLEFRGLVGYDFFMSETFILTPYIGYGYRYLHDDVSFDQYGYGRDSNYFYSPIGIETITGLGNGWFVGVKLEYDYFWNGMQRSYLSDIAGYSDAKNRQNRGYGCRGSIKLRKKGEKIDFTVEPFMRYWNIRRSETSYTTWYGISFSGVEPKNNSEEFGINFTVAY